ncbi:response regulator [Leptolyngbya ohadii]|uniref:response regulator n=1 Tax=Leptolyngbya ohadii TaxID=1962290 RepID=UPI000B59A3D9|nr:response regulator [Leptolyngbya ohadii]
MRENVGSCSTSRVLRVLVVDDDEDSCGFLTIALEAYGIETHIASSARQALKFLVKLQPDVLISDLAMPNEDGYWLIHQVRQIEAQRRDPTPAIAVTALSEKPQEALSRGFHCLLQKPVDVDDLVNEILNLVEQSKLAR